MRCITVSKNSPKYLFYGLSRATMVPADSVLPSFFISCFHICSNAAKNGTLCIRVQETYFSINSRANGESRPKYTVFCERPSIHKT